MAYNLVRLSVIKLFSGGKLTFDPCQLLNASASIGLAGKKAAIKLGRGTITRPGAALLADNGTISIGSQVFINRNSYLVSMERISIGNGCSLGPNVMIFDHDHVFGTDTCGGFKAAPIEIGDNVWIGANVVILRGTRIGSNCVIGAGTVVKGDIPEGSLVVQNRELQIRPIRNPLGEGEVPAESRL